MMCQILTNGGAFVLEKHHGPKNPKDDRSIRLPAASWFGRIPAKPRSIMKVSPTAWLGFCLAAGFAGPQGSLAFTSPPALATRVSSTRQVHPTKATATEDFTIQVVEGGEEDPRVLDVAAFRNGVVNPQMMVDKAQTKRDAVDTTSAAIDGLKIGVLYIAPLIGGFTYLEGNDPTQAIQNAVVLGGGVGAFLAANNYMGRGIHVPDIPEATNRIIVDYSEGLLRQQDVGFVAFQEDNVTFSPTRGVLAAVDVQLRNSEKSPSGVRKVANLPSHLHVKNMEVHSSMRRKGVGVALMDAIVEYAKTQTDAQALTLEVEAANPAAVNLYRKVGFEAQANPNKLSKNLFMIKYL